MQSVVKLYIKNITSDRRKIRLRYIDITYSYIIYIILQQTQNVGLSC